MIEPESPIINSRPALVTDINKVFSHKDQDKDMWNKDKDQDLM